MVNLSDDPAYQHALETTQVEVVEHHGVKITSLSGSGGLAGGGKGGGKGSKTPVEDKNSLRSIAYADVLYLLSEGEITGYPTTDGLRDIYLDDTPVKNPDGTYNFTNIQLYTAAGLQGQSYLPGFSETEAQIDVSTKVTVLQPVTRTLADTNADAVVVTLLIPQLQEIDAKSGNIHGSSVRFQIQISNNGGGFVVYVDDTITGKTTSNYQRSYRINLPKPGSWNIKVIRITPDSTEQRITNELYFGSYTAIIETKLNYPYSALLGMSVSAEQFKSLPKLSVNLLGIKVKFPSNYNPSTRQYTGTWNGTFTYEYTNNPAWILYDFLINTRYGCGKFISESQIDKWSFYQIAQYCDGLVPNGKGGYEPRFTCNCYITQRDDAYNMLNAFASVFRGQIYWANGTIFVTQDAPGNPVRLFTEANVKQEVDEQGHVTKPTFTYSGTSTKARHTAVLVSYSDPDDQYKTKVVYVEDRDGIARYGYRETQVTAFGCTSIGQAYRTGKWLLYTEQYETETVAFTVGSEGLLVRPGEIIKIADPLRAGVRLGGRILNVQPAGDSINVIITLDAPITMTAGNTYSMSFMNPSTGTLVEAPIVNAVGTFSQLVTPIPNPMPVVGSIWMVIASNVQPQLFRVLDVSEKSSLEYDITASAYNASKYAAVEQNLPLVKPKISQLPNLLTPPNAPTTLITKESLFNAGSGGVQVRVDITFKASTSPGIDYYQVEVRNSAFSSDPFTVLGTTHDLSYAWLNVDPGLYDFRVVAVNKAGYRSAYATQRLQVSGKNKPPSNVANLTASASGNQILLKWDSLADLDIQTGGFFKIKFTSSTSNVSWANGFDVALVSGGSTSATVPAYSGTYLIKAVSPLGYESVKTTIVDTTFAAVAAKNVVATFTDSPTFSGNKNNTIVTNGLLQLGSSDYFDISGDNTEMIDDTSEYVDLYAINFDDTPGSIDDPGDGVSLGFNVDDEVSTYSIVSSGSYDFSQVIDLGGKYLSNFSAKFSAIAANLFSNIDSVGTDNIDDSSELIDGDVFTGTTSQLLIATSDDNVTYSDYQNFSVGSYLGRYFKFRVNLSTSNQNYNVLVDQLAITVDMPDRTETGTFSSLSSSDITISYGAAFKSVPAVGITIVNGATGDYYTLSNQTASGFTVSVFNSSNTRIIRNVNWIAKGYGKVIT